MGFLKSLRKTPQEKAREKAEALLSEVQSLADIVNETASPSIFFEKYKLLVEKLRELACYEWLGFFSNSPLEDLHRAQNEKQSYIHNLIKRCSEQLSSDCKAHETPEERRQLIESFEDSFNDFAIYMSEDNVSYIQKCSNENYDQYVYRALNPPDTDLSQSQPIETAEDNQPLKIEPLQIHVDLQEDKEEVPEETEEEKEKRLQEEEQQQRIEQLRFQIEQRKREKQLQLQKEQQQHFEQVEAKKEIYKQLNAQRKSDFMSIVAERKKQEELRRQAHIDSRRKITQTMSNDELLQDFLSFVASSVFVSSDLLTDEFPTLSSEDCAQLLNQLNNLNILVPTAEPGRYRVVEKPGTIYRQVVFAPAEVQSGSDCDIDGLDGLQFEHYCSDLLHDVGFSNITITPASGDYGVDILAEKDGITYGIQCKCYTDKVGNHAVQEALAGCQFYHRMVAAVLTNSYFTAAAIESAKKMNVLLWDRDWIRLHTNL